MLPAQFANAVEASLGPLPTTGEFLLRIDRYLEKPTAKPKPTDAQVVLRGMDAAQNVPQPPTGTKKVRSVAYNAATDFQKDLLAKDLAGQLEDLDEWMTVFAKWALDPAALFDDEQAQNNHRQRTKEMNSAVAQLIVLLLLVLTPPSPSPPSWCGPATGPPKP